jgi:hypothetical protein
MSKFFMRLLSLSLDMIVSCQWSVVSCQLSVVSCQLKYDFLEKLVLTFFKESNRAARCGASFRPN